MPDLPDAFGRLPRGLLVTVQRRLAVGEQPLRRLQHTPAFLVSRVVLSQELIQLGLPRGDFLLRCRTITLLGKLPGTLISLLHLPVIQRGQIGAGANAARLDFEGSLVCLFRFFQIAQGFM